MEKIPNGLTIEQWDAICSDIKDNPSTINDYRKVLNVLHKYNSGQYHIATMSNTDAIAYFDYLDQRTRTSGPDHMSEKTAHRYKATLRSIGYKMQNKPQVFKNYRNPFANTIKHEYRDKSDFTKITFPSHEELIKFQNALQDFNITERNIMSLVLYLGFSPKQIESLKFSDFSTNESNGRKELVLKFCVGTFIDTSKQPWDKQPYIQAGYLVELDNIAKNGNVTWKYYAKFKFFDEFWHNLISMDPEFNDPHSNRPVFTTTHHGPYTYRTLNNLCNRILQQANLNESNITQTSLWQIGTIRSYMIDTLLRQHSELEKNINNTNKSEVDVITYLQHEVQQNENQLLPIIKKGWIGSYDRFFPLPKLDFVKDVQRQLGKDAINKIANLL